MYLTIKELADLAGVSTKTLRYYDQIKLLPPSTYTPAGYRQYSQKDIDRLHQILIYKALALPLSQIAHLLDQPEGEHLQLLKKHQQELIENQNYLNNLLRDLNQTIKHLEGVTIMSNEKKFRTFKQQIKDNDVNYGDGLRQTYGNQLIDDSHQTMSQMTEDTYRQWQAIEEQLLSILRNRETITIPSDDAQLLFNCHQQWLTQSWGSYDKKRHLGLGQLYLASPEFTSYYDSRAGVGATNYLVSVITYYASL